MATYAYRCASCGDFDVSRPIGTATPSAPCPRCQADAPRSYTAPLLATTPAPVRALRDREQAGGDQPAAVSAVPPARRTPRPAPHPAWSRLPRP